MYTTLLARTNRKRSAVALVGVAAVVALAGCSSPAPEETADPDALISVKVVIAPVMSEPIHYGIDNGVFEEHGLDVSAVDGGFLPAQQVPVLLSGDANIGMTGGLTLLSGIVEGLPVKSIRPVLNSSSEVTPDSGFILPPGSTITNWGELSNTTIAIPGLNEMPQLAISYAIDENGGDSSTVEFIELPITNINDAVKSGQVDGALQISTFYGQAVGEGFVSLGDPAVEYFDGAPTIQIMATDEYIAANAETIDKFNAAYDEIVEFLNANPDAIREIQRTYSELPDFVIDMAVPPHFFTTFDRAAYEKVISEAAAYGFIGEALPFEAFVWAGAPIAD